MATRYPSEVRRKALRLTKEKTIVETARILGLGEATIRRWAKEEREERPTDSSSHVSPVFDDMHIPSLDWRGALKAVRATQEVVRGASPGQHAAHVTIPTSEPIVLVPSGDWHLGGYATDYDQFEADIDYILSTPNLYVIDLGDGIDNFTAFRSVEAYLNQGVPPKIQKQILYDILAELVESRKLIARCWSNHVEEFDERAYGGSLDSFNTLCPYLKDDGRLFLKVGETTYNILARHDLKGRSIYHTNHGAKRATIFEWPDADIVLSAHSHDGPEHDDWLHGNQPRLALKVPAYKTEDLYARRRYGKSGIEGVGVQGIVLFPDRKQFVAFRDVEDAVVFRDAMIKRVGEGSASVSSRKVRS